MTQQRRDSHSTEFGIWLRKQPELDSKKHHLVASNVDYIWKNYRTNLWMFIEEKRYGVYPKFPQTEMFKSLDKACINDIYYKGFHLLIFEKTSPDDGRIYLDGRCVDVIDLIKFLRFEQDNKWYLSYKF